MRERNVWLIVAVALAVGFAAEYRALFFAECAPDDRLGLACLTDRLNAISGSPATGGFEQHGSTR